jgi:acyl-CoA synthetase (AMP-forming)/AMP-acid ligase II
MTETSPMGTNAKQVSKHEHLSWTIEERFANVTKAGIPAAGVELKIVESEVRPLGMGIGGSAGNGVLCLEIGRGRLLLAHCRLRFALSLSRALSLAPSLSLSLALSLSISLSPPPPLPTHRPPPSALLLQDFSKDLPQDGKAQGELLARGPWVTARYFKSNRGEFPQGGWLATGDIASIDAGGNLIIRDRSKDVIKSGGEWISSIDLEKHIVALPSVAACAVVAQPHPKWDERPVCVLVLADGGGVVVEGGDWRTAIRDHCKSRFAKVRWWERGWTVWLAAEGGGGQ